MRGEQALFAVSYIPKTTVMFAYCSAVNFGTLISSATEAKHSRPKPGEACFFLLRGLGCLLSGLPLPRWPLITSVLASGTAVHWDLSTSPYCVCFRSKLTFHPFNEYSEMNDL